MKIVFYIVFFLVLFETGVSIIKGIRGPSNNPWAGGNGCNLFNSTKRLACCTAHDKNYKEGGWWGARWDADAELFGCLWQHNKVLAPVMWFGTRAGGPIAFQYGKKRELPPDKE